jgi:low affinity Fe/Cu permease
MWLLSFMLNPSMALGIMVTKNATPVAFHNVLGVIEVLTADYHRTPATKNPDGTINRGTIIGTRTNADVARVTDYARNSIASLTGTKSRARQTRYSGIGLTDEGLIREAPLPVQQPIDPQTIANLAKLVQASPQWQAMHKQALSVLQGTVTDVLQRTERIQAAKNLTELEKATNVNLSSIKSELEKKLEEELVKLQQKDNENLKQQKLQQNEAILVQKAKEAYKSGRVAMLEKMKNHWAQVPDAVGIYDQAIQKINNL